MSEMNEATPPAPPSDMPSAEERQWAMFAHLSSLAGLLTGGLGCIIGPLVIWLIKKETMPFVDDQGKEALNFNITIAIAMLISWILMFVLIGLLLIPIVGIAWLVLTIIATMKANEGQRYRYPFAIRLVK